MPSKMALYPVVAPEIAFARLKPAFKSETVECNLFLKSKVMLLEKKLE